MKQISELPVEESDPINNNPSNSKIWNLDYTTGDPLQRSNNNLDHSNSFNNIQSNSQNSQNFQFTNPWDNEKITNNQNNLTNQQFQQQRINSITENDNNLINRRKSSLVIPPARAPGPNPFHYDALMNNQNISDIYNQPQHQQQQPNIGKFQALQQHRPSLMYNQLQRQEANHIQQIVQAQQAQQNQINTRLLPSLYNSQDFQRRQSVATAHYDPNNYYQVNSNNTSSNLPFISPYRRLSAYPTAQTGFKQPLRRSGDEFLTKPQSKSQLTIPQMSIIRSKNDLKPQINKVPKYRRASLNSKTISPLIGLTKNLITTYQLCSSEFVYQTSKNPKRVLTKPSEGKCNNGYDNINSDYILYVNDVLGVEQNRKYLVLDILGQGTFGQVVKCQNLMTKEILAVKVIKSKSEYLNQSLTEVKILELINEKIDPDDKHHFLRMFDSFVHKNHLCLVFELLSNNLYELLKQNQYHGLSMQLIKIFTKQMLDSLCVLKDSKLIHCDLKPENILLCSLDKPDIKIVDFGSSCDETKTIYTYIQSRFYRAPEVILGIPYSSSIDMWSFGCIIAELFLGIPIFPGASEYNQITRIINTLNYPPNWMLEMGKNTSKFLRKNETYENKDIDAHDSISESKFHLKSLEEFSQDFPNANEQPSKQYFKWNKLRDIIKNYKIPKNIQHSSELIEHEMQNRECLIHFLSGILNLNPLERWTPQQASLHPFVTNQPFTSEWYPPGPLYNKKNNSNRNNNRHRSLHEGLTAKQLNGLTLEE